MSTDFTTGKNKNISKDDLYLMKCDVLSKILNLSHKNLYNFYKSKGECAGSGQWSYYDRYTNEYNSNDYVGNPLDNILILSAAVDKEEFLDKSDETVESRKNLLMRLCSSYIEENKCNNFNLSGLFPHLDKVDNITINSVSGFIPCIEVGYETFIPVLTYCDSCGQGYPEPVPEYPIGYTGNMFEKLGNQNQYRTENSEFEWQITRNADQAIISPETASMNLGYIEIAALSTASLDDIDLEIKYSEN